MQVLYHVGVDGGNERGADGETAWSRAGMGGQPALSHLGTARQGLWHSACILGCGNDSCY